MAAGLPASELAAAPEAAVAAPAAQESPAAPVVADAPVPLLVFSAKAPSWVQVKDARGAVALQKSLIAGETVQVTAALPVSVVVGRVDATTVQLRGQAFDLAAVARDNVARFEVKQ
ncbi:cytoskeletal protein RodZ [compost metagenome]